MLRNDRLICPRCRGKLKYIDQHGQLFIYQCPMDGPMVYPPDGNVRPETPEETAQRMMRGGPAAT